MALTTPKVLFGPTQLTNADVTQYTSAVNTYTTVTRAVFTNVAAAAVLLTVNVVRSGGSVAGTNQVIGAYPISAGEAYVAAELAGLILGPGDFISAKASAGTSINAVGSGYTG